MTPVIFSKLSILQFSIKVKLFQSETKVNSFAEEVINKGRE